jgi:hypothetical protein
MKVRREWAVVLIGLAAGLVIAVAPDGALPVVALVAAVAAGVVLFESPMVAAMLVLAPTIVLAVVRTAVDSASDLGAMTLAIISSVFVTAIVTHVAAAITARRRARLDRVG